MAWDLAAHHGRCLDVSASFNARRPSAQLGFKPRIILDRVERLYGFDLAALIEMKGHQLALTQPGLIEARLAEAERKLGGEGCGQRPLKIVTPRSMLCAGPEREAATTPWTPSADNSWFQPATKFYLSTNLLEQGDVILFAPLAATAAQIAIRRMQRRWGSNEEHSRFTHAALYVGLDHLVCQAIPFGGVQYATIEHHLDGNCCIARRWPGLNARQRGRIAAQACSHLGKPYGWKAAVLESLKRGWGVEWDDDAERGLVCSRLCDRSITAALLDEGLASNQLQFHPDPKSWITPAILRESTRLQDIDLQWCRVTARNRLDSTSPAASILLSDGCHQAAQ